MDERLLDDELARATLASRRAETVARLPVVVAALQANERSAPGASTPSA